MKLKRKYLKSGLYVRRPQLPGPETEAGRVIAERRAGLVADLGGDLIVAQMALVELAMRSWALLDSVDAYLLTLPSPCDR